VRGRAGGGKVRLMGMSRWRPQECGRRWDVGKGGSPLSGWGWESRRRPCRSGRQWDVERWESRGGPLSTGPCHVHVGMDALWMWKGGSPRGSSRILEYGGEMGPSPCDVRVHVDAVRMWANSVTLSPVSPPTIVLRFATNPRGVHTELDATWISGRLPLCHSTHIQLASMCACMRQGKCGARSFTDREVGRDAGQGHVVKDDRLCTRHTNMFKCVSECIHRSRD